MVAWWQIGSGTGGRGSGGGKMMVVVEAVV